MELYSLNDVGTLLKVDWFINFNTLIEGSTFTRLNDVGTLLKVDWFINFNASIEGSTFTRLNVSTLPDDFTAFLMVNFHIGTISCLFCAFWHEIVGFPIVPSAFLFISGLEISTGLSKSTGIQ